MILVRVEPVSSGKFPMTVEEKQTEFFSRIPERIQERMRKKFHENDMGSVLGCWFSPAYAESNGTLDALEYANDIISADHEDSDLRLIAIELSDEETDNFCVSNMPEDCFARQRSRNTNAEFVIPTEIIMERGKEIMIIDKNTKLNAETYRSVLLDFERNENVPSLQLDSTHKHVL
jgi:hypothetical protein